MTAASRRIGLCFPPANNSAHAFDASQSYAQKRNCGSTIRGHGHPNVPVLVIRAASTPYQVLIRVDSKKIYTVSVRFQYERPSGSKKNVSGDPSPSERNIQNIRI